MRIEGLKLFCRLVLTAALVAGLTLVGPAAAAQDFEDFIAEPLTSERFAELIVRLQLDYDQRLAAEQAHEEYKARIFRLVDNDVMEMMQKVYEMEGGGRSLPDRKKVDELLELRADIADRVRGYDRALFDQIEQHLREDQSAALARVKRQRERQTYELELFNMGEFSGTTPNLVQLIDRLDLEQPTLDEIDPTLVSYEKAVNAALKETHDATFGMITKLFDALADMGFGDGEEIDEQDQMRMFMAMQQIMNKAAQDLMEARKRVDEVSKNYQRRLTAMLPLGASEQFDRDYLAVVYPDVFRDHSSVEKALEVTLKSDDLAGDVRSSVQAIRDSWRRQYDEINRRLMANTDEMRDASSGPFAFFGGGSEKYWEVRQELEAERGQLHQRTRDQLASLLDQELADEVAHISGPAEAYEKLYDEAYGAEAEMIAAEAFFDAGSAARGFDQSIPAAITEDEFAGYAHRMGMTDAEIAIATAILEDYRGKYDELVNTELTELINPPRQRMYNDDASDRDWNALMKARETAVGQVLELEDELFSDLAALLSADQLKRLPDIRTARSRLVYDMGEDAGMYWEDDYVDVIRLLNKLEMPANVLHQVHPVLASLDQDLLPIVRAQYEAVLEHEVAQVRASRMMSDWNDDPEAAMQGWQKYQEIIGPYEKKLRDLMEQRSGIEKDSIDEIRDALPSRYAVKFDQEFNKLKYPEIWPDPHDAGQVFPYVLALRSLSADQRGQVDSVWAEHSLAHETMSTEMMEIADSGTDWPDFSGDNPEEVRDWQRREMRAEILRYRRRELNETTLRRVRTILSQDQAAQVRGLAVEAN